MKRTVYEITPTLSADNKEAVLHHGNITFMVTEDMLYIIPLRGKIHVITRSSLNALLASVRHNNEG